MNAGTLPSYRIRLCEPEDAKGVRDVLEATYGADATSAAIYDWWSLAFSPDAHGFMVAEVRDRIVGVQPMNLFPYVDGPEALLGGMLTGVAVHPDFRRQGIFTGLIEACEAAAWRRGAAFVTTMPNDQSRPGFVKMGYVDLGRRRLLMRLLRPRMTGGERVPLIGHLAGAGAGAVQALMSRSNAAQVEVIEVGAPGAEWVAVFEQHARRNPGVRLGRSKRWLDWRYGQVPAGRSYRFFEAHAKDSTCVAVAITTQEMRSSLLMAYLMEIAAVSDEIAGALVKSVAKELGAAGVDALSAVVSSSTQVDLLRRSGLLEVPAWAPLKRFYSVARFNPDLKVPERWKNIGGWQQTLGDWDNL
ncbi:GNAT family N-acetyltransferase [Thiocapsa rosea]|uniref:Putative N-acetyltransferase YhbS n=1 Tax=Thiocapsa rosea TaxID=69360 RepID=A0A495V844_9GAMM|nr:GNAT family N-acetyltransferase [Thiocapsa rosea]RKT45582.1 putative N-acetyltransferase YhbS [Thiocapsa rosea]